MKTTCPNISLSMSFVIPQWRSLIWCNIAHCENLYRDRQSHCHCSTRRYSSQQWISLFLPLSLPHPLSLCFYQPIEELLNHNPTEGGSNDVCEPSLLSSLSLLFRSLYTPNAWQMDLNKFLVDGSVTQLLIISALHLSFQEPAYKQHTFRWREAEESHLMACVMTEKKLSCFEIGNLSKRKKRSA